MSAIDARTITVSEFGRIYAGQTYDGVMIQPKDIQELRGYIDEQNTKVSGEKAHYYDFLKPIRNGVQVNNYVGVLQTDSGLTIEILPKIYGKSASLEDKKVIRNLFFQMLKTARNINGKYYEMTNLDMRRNTIFEVFISMFLTQSSRIFKQGIKANYVSIQSNERFLKGKLLTGSHIRKNSFNNSKFYNEFDEYQANIPENQLLKTTLIFLLKRSKDHQNLRLIKEQLLYFDNVDEIRDPNQTFHKVQLGRDYVYYRQALEWCKIFLRGQSFTSFKGSSLAFALLFPMDKIFEAYISSIAIKSLPEYEISAQDKTYWLFDGTEETSRGYQLRPDLVLRDVTGKQTIIVDTKWKLLDHTGPTQADLYQMYVYFTRYKHNKEDVDKVILLYPYSENYNEQEFRSIKKANAELGAKVQVRFVDLLSVNIEEEVCKILK